MIRTNNDIIYIFRSWKRSIIVVKSFCETALSRNNLLLTRERWNRLRWGKRWFTAMIVDETLDRISSVIVVEHCDSGRNGLLDDATGLVDHRYSIRCMNVCGWTIGRCGWWPSHDRAITSSTGSWLSPDLALYNLERSRDPETTGVNATFVIIESPARPVRTLFSSPVTVRW